MKNNRRFNKGLKIFSVFLVLSLILSSYVLFIELTGKLPAEYNITLGNSHIFNSRFPFSFRVTDSSKSIIQFENTKDMLSKVFNRQIELEPLSEGSTDLQLRIFGLVPYKNLKVNVVPQVYVMPGGQSIGVRLNTEGVLVVGVAEITDDTGKKRNIAEENGIRLGDTLIEINDDVVVNSLHVADIVKNSNGEEIKLKFLRDTKEYEVNVKPIKSSEDLKYRLGLWVRDKTAGVGTMTFYEQNSSKFGALGHAITDADTGSLLSVKDGEIISSRVVSIEQGQRGKPGEIKGVFYNVNEPLGKLEKNTPFGVYGELIRDIPNDLIPEPIPIAFQHEVKEGKAYILTTTDDNEIQQYEIEITKVNPQSKPSIKSMIVKITDEKLLNKTGGIVQGMSGSPIIQNGKIVGAITHVLINDPTRGYGVYIEWMIEQAGIYE